MVGHDLDSLAAQPTDTLGGLILALADRVPEAGEVVEYVGWRFEVTASDGRRIERTRIYAPERALETAV